MGEANKLIRKQLEIKRKLKQFIDVAGVEARNHFVKSFSNEGFTDETLSPWKARKSLRDRGRAILVKSGRLRGSIRVIRKSFNSVTIGAIGYGKFHNEGTVRLPKRQFMGYSAQLSRLLKSRLQQIFR